MNNLKINNPIEDLSYIFATQFYREPHLPISDLKKDMLAIKKLGLNTIKIQEDWTYEEPAEGEYDFRIMEELTAEAARVGLHVFFTLCMEVPPWAWKKYPDALRISENGSRQYSYNSYGYTDGKPGPCWNHPGMRKIAEKFLASFATRLGRFKNVIMWQAYQELNAGRIGIECFCPRCRALFRSWLKKKYRTLKILNSAWMIKYGDWDEIEPSRQIWANQRSGPSYADWWKFSREQAGIMLKWRADALRINDPYHRPVSVNTSSPHFGQEWVWQLSDKVDIYGTSFYPGYFHVAPIPGFKLGAIPDKKIQLPHDMWHTCLWFDYIRVAAKGAPWASEFQAGPAGGYLHHGADPTAEDMQRWLLLTLSAGVKGVSFWNYRPEYYGGEGHRYGIFGKDMTASAKTKEIGLITAAVAKHETIFKQGQLADIEVAILVNDDTVRHLEICSGEAIYESICGLYRTLWRMGVNVDFLSSSDLESGRASNYKAAFLPFPLAMSDKYAGLLKKYVHQGGTLISEACPGRYSDWDMANYQTGFAPGLDELFGCREKTIQMCIEQDREIYNEGKTRINWHKSFIGPLHLRGVNDFKGIKLPASFYLETFDLTAGTPVFMNEDQIAGVVNTYGEGKTYLLGTFPSVAMMHTTDDNGLEKTLALIFKRLKITGHRCGDLILRRLKSDAGEIWFLINPTEKSVSRNIDFPRSAFVSDLLDGAKIGKHVTVSGFSVKALVLDRKDNRR